MLGVVTDMGIPPIQGTDLARFSLEVSAFAALERLGRKIDKGVGPDLQPVALP